jgi:ubiquinone/menaquinone biosynthesis C-methylase UbiE
MLFILFRRKGELPAPRTRGAVIRWPRTYDLILWVFTRGREQELRQTTADLAQLQRGETVLDVGCASGTLALVAQECVGLTGRVSGINLSREMIVQARRKAARAGLSIDFQLGVIEQLAFPDQSFDVVLCTWMIHHVPDDLKRQGLLEIARVLKPGGRLLLVDSNLNSLSLKEAGFSQMESGQLPFPMGLGFVRTRTALPGVGRVTW